MNKTLLVTGCCGFIGSHFAHMAISQGYTVIGLDSLTYAANRLSIADIEDQMVFIEGNICDRSLILDILETYKPNGIVNFAAESHVGKSITDTTPFIISNIQGPHNLAECCMEKLDILPQDFKFIQIGTDEVYGEVFTKEEKFHVESGYDPRNLYSATKAAANHVVMSYYHVHNLPVIVTGCSNNFGEGQNSEKFIPNMCNKIKNGHPILIHGDGSNFRDWIAVQDHCRGVLNTFENGTPGKTYLFGGGNVFTNLEIANKIVKLAEKQHHPIEFVQDRKTNDKGYSIDFSFAKKELGWSPDPDFESNLKKTVESYLS